MSSCHAALVHHSLSHGGQTISLSCLHLQQMQVPPMHAYKDELLWPAWWMTFSCGAMPENPCIA